MCFFDMLNLQSLAFKISLVRSLASLGLSYNKQMNANPLHLLGNVTFLEVLAWWVFWLKCFPVCLDKKNLAWPSFVLFIGQYISCLICPHIHIFIHHIICSVGVCVCACALTTQSQKTLHLSASKMIGYLFFILPIPNFASIEWPLTRLRWRGSVSTPCKPFNYMQPELERLSLTWSLRSIIMHSDGCRPPVPILHVSP